MKTYKNTLLVISAVVTLASCGGSDNKTENTTPPANPLKSLVADVIEVPADVNALLGKNTCLTCHKVDEKLVGPPYTTVAQNVSSVEEIIGLIREPKPEHYPDYPEMAGIDISEEDGKVIAEWILSLKK